MALVWLAVDGRLLDAVLGFAAASWEREEFDAAWRGAGWYVPAGGSVADELFDGLEQRQWTGDRFVDIGLAEDLGSVVAVTIEFATFVDPADEEDGEPLITPDKLELGWSGLAEGTREDFDWVWWESVEVVKGRLGEPETVGTHHDHWHHAIWRVGDALIALMQGEHMETYGFWDEATVWVVPHPAERPVPSGRELYDVMWGPVRKA